MKRGSASQVFKEVEVKTMRYGHTPLGMARSQDTDTTRRWRGTGCARPAGVHARWCGRSGRQRGRVFQHETSFHRIIQHSHTLVSLQMSQKRKKNLRPHACAHGCLHHLYSQLPRLRSNGDGEAFGKRTAKGAAASRRDSCPRGHELPSHETTRRKLKSSLPSRRRQSEKATRCAVPPLGQPRKSKIVRTAGRSTFSGIAGGREGCLAEAQRIVRAVTTLCMLRG